MDKKKLTETDIRTKFITPAIVSKWDVMRQMREEVFFTKGRVIVRGKTIKRGDPKKADYILYYQPNLPIAIVEAKDNKHSVGAGMQQALEYAETLDIPFAYSSNGDAFLEHDRTGVGECVTREIPLDQFPSPEELWDRYCLWKGYSQKQKSITTEPYYDDGSGKMPRYYQLNAINRTVDAIARGENRVLLVMATGTGKTYTAFQIIWRLWKSGAKKRILFLVDRNILANQTMTGDFKPLKSAMCKLSAKNNTIESKDGSKIVLPSGVTQDRKIDKSYEIYLSLYQAVTGTDEESDLYKQFSPDFFDLIIVDECHRGSAAEDSAWRDILEYFSSATQIGLTATPKETKDISNSHYFGNPVYTYSLKEGIADGFLAPYKVIRVGLDKDHMGWRPTAGQRDKYGELIEDRVYDQKDYDRNLILEKRTEAVASRITEYLKSTDRFAKTIVFCENVDHAERMRQALVNQNKDLSAANNKYIMRITGDNEEGKAQLDNFIDPESKYPVIATTSRLMTTGVDAQTCKLIVLDRIIESTTEFKQIIGRGTRINEDYHKLYFTIMDFRLATKQFADPDFDDFPEQVYEPGSSDPIVPPDEDTGDDTEQVVKPSVNIDDDLTVGGSGRKVYVVNSVPVSVASEQIQYLDANGKLITESLKDYSRKTVLSEYSSLDNFLNAWTEAEKKQAVIEALAEKGVFLDDLAEQVGKDYDAFDLICHIAYDRPPLTRRERVNNVKKRDVFSKYGADARAVLESLLEKYADNGLRSLESMEILRVAPISQLGTPMQIINFFGGKEQYQAAIAELESAIFSEAA